MSALGQKQSFTPDQPNVRFAPEAVIHAFRLDMARSSASTYYFGTATFAFNAALVAKIFFRVSAAAFSSARTAATSALVSAAVWCWVEPSDAVGASGNGIGCALAPTIIKLRDKDALKSFLARTIHTPLA
jgi:hypothetical protein